MSLEGDLIIVRPDSGPPTAEGHAWPWPANPSISAQSRARLRRRKYYFTDSNQTPHPEIFTAPPPSCPTPDQDVLFNPHSIEVGVRLSPTRF